MAFGAPETGIRGGRVPPYMNAENQTQVLAEQFKALLTAQPPLQFPNLFKSQVFMRKKR